MRRLSSMSIRDRSPGRVLGCLVVAVAVAACGSIASPPQSTTTPEAPSPTAPLLQVRLFFTARGVDPCGAVAPVVRSDVALDPSAALAALLAGPSAEETTAGFSSPFGPATADALEGVAIVDGVAHVSFTDVRRLIPNASSACGSATILAALDATLAQFPGIGGARYSIGGDESAFYEWLQLAPPD